MTSDEPELHETTILYETDVALFQRVIYDIIRKKKVKTEILALEAATSLYGILYGRRIR